MLEQVLSQRLADQMAPVRAPAPIRRFVTATWAKVLAESMVRFGEQVEPTPGYLRAVDDLLSAGESADLDLGTVEISRTQLSGGNGPADNIVLLGEKQSKNPLSVQDSDGDGVPDKDDPDDDDDLIPDDGDDDANGDGVVDGNEGAIGFYTRLGGQGVGAYTDPGPRWRSRNLVFVWDDLPALAARHRD